MEVILESEFRNNIEILRYIQMKMISILTCEEMILGTKIKQFFSFFKEKSLSKDFSLYEGFLRIFVHLSIYFNFNEREEKIPKRQGIFFTILKELIEKFSLKESFHPSTLFFIFKANKHLTLFLLEEKIIDISFIEVEISCNKIRDIFLFFLPEIKKANPTLYSRQMKRFNLKEDFINSLYFQSNYEGNQNSNCFEPKYANRSVFNIRERIHSQEKIAQLIRSDNINDFIEHISKMDGFDLNSTIEPSFLENNSDINNPKNKRINLLEYSMAFGSINIFRYLWMNKVEYSKESLNYSIIGGNFEIIHILEEESKFIFDEECYNKSWKYFRLEINEYLSSLLGIPQPTFPDVLSTFHCTTNIELIFDFFVKNHSSINNLSIDFHTIQLISPMSFYFIYLSFFKLKKIDIQATNDALFYIFDYLSN
ncbi:hypothetical protein TRFO_12270 [Tritrichomonas foetus]|uniref:DUF3447 domain-containing protein n=1 Tax=Tritrichomonas foetus TaxID=1144522 RepID=A0A1J4J608_9EUKA|nr:hypothetical protein TRFO_12270 [Tritrichomonas foetus]|eukprot:OHS92885.1 hypothetical protein TRFO_12270 [Tritrichomonas foetus]